MIIRTSEGDKSVASGGVGGTALGLSIGALSLAALQGNNGNGYLATCLVTTVQVTIKYLH